MADPIVIRLAGEPRGKGRPRFVRATGIAFTPAHTRAYESHLRFAGQEAMEGRPPLEGPLEVCVFAYFPVPKSWPKRRRAEALQGIVRPVVMPDADNLMKMLDGLNEVVWRDDRQIVDGYVRKLYSDTPQLVVTVKPVEPFPTLGLAGAAA